MSRTLNPTLTLVWHRSLSLPQVTQEHLIQALPFGGEVTVVRVSPEALVIALEKSVESLSKTHGPAPSEQATPHGRFLQVSGLTFTWGFDDESGMLLVSDVLLDQAPISDFTTITVATIAFLANGGDSYDVLNVADKNGLGVSITEAVGEYLTAHAHTSPGLAIASESTGRITSTFLQLQSANQEDNEGSDATKAGVVGAIVGGVGVPLCILLLVVVRRTLEAQARIRDRKRSDLQALSQAERDGFNATSEGSVAAEASRDGCVFWFLDAHDLRELDADGLRALEDAAGPAPPSSSGSGSGSGSAPAPI